MLRQAEATRRARDSLVDMVTRDPDVVSCLHRVYNTVLLNDIEVAEGAARVAPELLRTINREYKRFFKDAVVLAHTCGFVPYYIARSNGAKLPRCLPLGSFSWRVAMREDARAGLAGYEVNVVSGKIAQDQVLVFETEAPVLGGYDICSPLAGVHNQFLIWKDAETQLSIVSEWNTSKHFAVTERIDVKDQTTSGIQLLDEQRRYNLTGQHNSVVHDSMLRLTGAGVTASVQEAFHHAVHTQFQDRAEGRGEPRVGSKRASVHLLPPNTDVQELSTMDTGTAMRDAKTEFQEAVYTYFGLSNINRQLDEAGRRGATSIHREQYSNILYMQTVLERLGEAAYAQCFGVKAHSVRFTLRALPRFEIASVDDIKTLAEIGMLSPADMAHLRLTILNRSA